MMTVEYLYQPKVLHLNEEGGFSASVYANGTRLPWMNSRDDAVKSVQFLHSPSLVVRLSMNVDTRRIVEGAEVLTDVIGIPEAYPPTVFDALPSCGRTDDRDLRYWIGDPQGTDALRIVFPNFKEEKNDRLQTHR